MSKKVMIIAGEASGDLHGAALINALKSLNNDLEITGIGGNNMIESGMGALYHIRDMSFLGFAEVIEHLPFIRKVRKDILNKIVANGIKEVVLIDYPGFNLNIAPKLKKLGVKVIYYISPQVWAWGQGRIKKIRKYVDKMIVVFPFEKDFYSKAGIDVEYVGHPLLERIDNYSFLTKEKLYEELLLDEKKEILLLMPGSRKQEIERIFPQVIEGAKKIADKYNMQIVVACSENIEESFLKSFSGDIEYKTVTGSNYDLMKYAKFGIIKSGTSTLEAGLMQLPGIVVYKTGNLTYLIGKSLIKVKNIAMANILAEKKLLDELIQNDVNNEAIFKAADKILSDGEIYNKLKDELAIIKDKLGDTGASKRAAEIIISEMNES